jgi:hypothetical protein
VRASNIAGNLFCLSALSDGLQRAFGRFFTREDAMEAALERIMLAYDLLANRTPAEIEAARAQVTDYVTTLFEAGERDADRLALCGLTYLRERDGTVDPVKSGYTGL